MAESAATGQSNPLIGAVSALAVVGLVALDARPQLHGALLLGCGLAAVLQLARELAVAFADRRVYLSVPVMDLVGPIVLLHTVYLARWKQYSTFLELVGVVLLSLFMLVFVSALTTDAKVHGWRSGLRDLALSLLLPSLAGFALGCAAGVQAWPTGDPATGSLRLALVLASAWAGCGLAASFERKAPAGAASFLGGVAASFVVLVGATAAAGLGPLGPAAALGAVVGLSTALGRRLIASLRVWAGKPRWRAPLPQQASFLQPLYDALYEGGAMDYAGPLMLALPAARLLLMLTAG